MRNTILRKTIFAYVLFALLCFLAVATISYRIDLNRIIQLSSEEMYLQAVNIAASYGNQYYTSNETLTQITNELSAIAALSETRIMLISPQNFIIIDTATPATNDFVSIPDFDPAASGNRLYTTGTFYNTLDEECLTVTVPIVHNLAVRGYVSIHKPVQVIQSQLNTVFNTNYYTMLLCCLLALIFVLLVYHEVHKPLKSVSRAVDEFGKGNLSYRIKKYRNDEIGRLAASLNYMAARLDETEQSERAFVANVSHDFRSPLTSIKGYLEAILDGTIPHENQDKYLNIVISETDRLTKLTNNLLSLNNMDARKNHLNLSVFDINTVIKKTLETFEGTCKAKDIKFDLEFVEQYIPVLADPDKITQVLYNLIDNAIKFSHNNSTIRIKVSERGERAFISIKDTGIGIPKDSIDKIWERFYKTDLSRGKDKKGTGLGLSIVKEIIKAHHENIDVISTEGVGTEFIFSLKRNVEDKL
jgi:signal transduction histidine kinase